MDEFRDFFLRQSLGQQGPRHYGGWASPDVVPWGAEPDPDPAALAGAMGVDPGRPLVAGKKNYVYVRSRNADPATARSGQLFVGWAAPAYLVWPDALQEILNASGKPYFLLAKVQPDAVGVSTEAFEYVPSAAGDALCGLVFTRDHPVKPPTLRSVLELARFLGDTPAYAQRNVGFDTAADGSYHFVGAYEQRDVPATMQFAIQTADCRGCTVSLRAVGGGDKVNIQPTTVTSDNFGVAVDVDLPAGYETTLDFGIETAAVELRPTARMRVGVSVWEDEPDAGVRLEPAVRAGLSIIPLGGHEWRATVVTAD